jgi:hypothetical protein
MAKCPVNNPYRQKNNRYKKDIPQKANKIFHRIHINFKTLTVYIIISRLNLINFIINKLSY